MSDYLRNLISRSFNQTNAIRPRPSSLFEPTSSTDMQTFQHVNGGDASDEPHFHPEVSASPSTPPFPITKPTNAGVPTLTDEPSDPEAPGTVRPKTEDPVVEPVVSPSKGFEIEKKASPSKTETDDPAIPGGPVRITPSHLGSDNLVPKERDLIPSSSESTNAPEKVIRPRQVEARNHPGDIRKVLPVDSEADKTSDNSEKSLPSKGIHVKRGFTDRRGMKSIVAIPHVSTHIEKSGMVSIEPAKTTDGPSSVNVTIGRVEVRAIMPEAQPARQPRAVKTGPSLSLDDYLKQRNGGQR